MRQGDQLDKDTRQYAEDSLILRQRDTEEA